MGERGYQQVAAQAAEQMQQVIPISPATGRRGLAHAVEQFQKMDVDTAYRVGAYPEMCGDAFDQRRMKRPDLRVVLALVQCAELVGCSYRAHVRKQCPQVVCGTGTAPQPRSELPDAIQHAAEPGRATPPCPAACRAISRRIERSSRARLRPASAVWNNCILHNATVVPMNNATLLLSAPTTLTVLVAPRPAMSGNVSTTPKAAMMKGGRARNDPHSSSTGASAAIRPVISDNAGKISRP